MKVTLFVLASVMTSYVVLGAPPQIPPGIEKKLESEAEAKLEQNLKMKLEEIVKEKTEKKAQAEIDEKVEEMKLNAEEQLIDRLQTVLVHAELEMEELEIKSEIIQKIKDHPNVFTHEQLILLNRLVENIKAQGGDMTLEQLLLDKILLEDAPVKAEELLKKIESDRSSSGGDGMMLEQKILEEKLARRVDMNHQELLKLAELRARRSGATTLQELFLLHHRQQTFTPKELILLRSLTPNQILKFYFLQNAEDMLSHGSAIELLMKQLADISHTKGMMESHKVLLYSLIKNEENKPSLSLPELELIQGYHQNLVKSLRRSMTLLVMSVMDLESSGSVTMQEKELLMVLVRRVEEVQMELSMLMNVEEVALLRRLRHGGVGMVEKLSIHAAEESSAHPLRSDLRALVVNKLRVDLVKGSGLAMSPSGDFLPEFMSDEEWKNATDCERTLELWTLYKLRHNRSYRTRLEERIRRRHFEKRVSEIVTHNIEFQLGRQIFSMGLNNHSDRTDNEMTGLKGYMNTTQLEALMKADEEAQDQDVAAAKRVPIVIPSMPTYTNTIPTSQLPIYVNWTTTGWVGPVQNQGQCGSCWSFSSSGALEAQYYNKTKTFVTMSEQNLVDCTYYLGNMGCSGGYIALAFEYVMNVGIDTYASYPYTARLNNGVCKYNETNSVTQDSGWMNIPSGNELALQQAVAMVGPVSVAIDASLSSFDSYTSGVYAPTNCSTTALDHAVLVVGYGTTSQGQDYWLIKNSWGTDWGMNGYFMMLRGVNMCGVATEALFPLIN